LVLVIVLEAIGGFVSVGGSKKGSTRRLTKVQVQSLLKGMRILGACACLDVMGLGDEATALAQN